jgi:hypothetical protein
MNSIVGRLPVLFRAVRRVTLRSHGPRRRADGREAVADALAAVRARRESRLRAALDERLEQPVGGRAGSEAEWLVLGRGSVEIPTGDRAAAAVDGPERAAPTVLVGDAPLTARAAHGVEVQAPPPLARLIVDAYRHQLDVRYGPAERDGVRAAPVAGAATDDHAPDPLRARVWIAPDGRAFARTPLEARGLWVPLEIRL